MDIDTLKEGLNNKLTKLFKGSKIETNLKIGHFVITREQYTLTVVVNSKELAYSFKLNGPINTLVIGFGEDYEIPQSASESEMEEIYKNVQDDIYFLLKSIADNEIYVGHNNKTAYIAYRYKDSYMLREFKKALFFGVSMQEKPTGINTIKRLKLKSLDR